MRSLAKVVRMLFPAACSIILLGLLVALTDLGNVAGKVAAIPLLNLAAAVAAMFLTTLVGAWRFSIVVQDLSAIRPAVLSVLRINLISLLATHLLPAAMLADVLRAAAVYRVLRLRPSLSAISVLHDRLFALLGFVVSATIVVPLQIVLGVDRRVILTSAALATGTVVAAVLVRVAVARSWLPNWRLINSLRHRIADFGSHLTTRQKIIAQVGLALASTALFSIQIYVLALGLGVAIPITVVLAFAPAIALSQAIPFLYAGFGAREFVVVALLSGGGWTSLDKAVALGLAIGITNLLTGLFGIPAIWSLAKDLGQLIRAR